ncbi:MAG: hypothetical protein WEA58_07710 [Balneolaceae bacterium]
MKKLLLFSLLLFITVDAFAQGFNSTSGRNHPELNWQVAETQHFLIMYPERISGIEAEAAAIAEETYQALSKNMGVEFSDKIRIYLTDQDEINNGFASPIGKGYTNIWLNTNDYSEIWTGQEKWLRKVVAHELAHIFHFKATWSNMGLLQFALGEPFTRSWAEGMGQYQTETWDSQRGDRWLRKAIFDSRPGFNDGQSNENGRLMYAVGNSQLRYFTKKYGDSTLVDMLAQRKSVLGIFDRHDFYDAFDETVEGGFNAFYEDWRKHMNVYYNSMAANMERVDSLNADLLPLPGQFYYDMAVSPDDSLIAVLSLTSLARPVRRLFIVQNDSTRKTTFAAEGSINIDVSWSADGKDLYYSRNVRGENSSLVNDIFSYDIESGKEKRLTVNRRARFPVAGPGESEISYIVNEDGTGNLFVMNLESGDENQITDYEGDIQLLWPLWIESKNSWLFHRFDVGGSRNLVLYDRETHSETILDEDDLDNRKAVLSPNENQIAYTSLRDDVPNVFIYDFESDSSKRVTNLFTGGEVHGWMAKKDTLDGERILVQASETKRSDGAYWMSPEREVYQPDFSIPEAYTSWTQKTPPTKIPSFIEPDESLISDRYPYSSFKNITHAASFALPYYANRDDWGLFATTNWVEPLGKHAISALGWVSIANPAESSFGSINYLNNQFYPWLRFSVYKIPGNGRFYGDEFLFEELTGGEIYARWPLDLFEAPYQTGSIDAQLRHVLRDPIGPDRFDDSPRVPTPQTGRQTDLQIGWQINQQRPWRDNVIHPLDGRGIRIAVRGSDKILASDVRFLTAELNTYTVLPSIGLHRIFAQFRAQSQWGEPFPQDYIGFSRYDNISLSLPDEVPQNFLGDADRVRGYRSFITGSQVAFGSLEYRIPFIPSLQTTILGVLNLGSTTLSLFSDAGVVRNARLENGTRDTVTRWGAGAEIKNHLRLFGVGFSHALGVAQPTEELFTDADVDFYYRVKAVVPF